MATVNFKDRFKDKISKMGRFGELEIDSNKAVSKHSSCLQTKSNFKLVANSVLNISKVDEAKLILPEENPSQFVRPIKVSIQPKEGMNLDNELGMKLRSIQSNSRFISIDESYIPLDRYNYQTSYSPPIISKVDKSYSNITSQSKVTRLKPSTVSPPIRHILSSPLGNKPCTSDQAASKLTPVDSHKLKRVEFKPYTIQDYANIKLKNYYELGGLGPVSIGTEDWKRRKEQQDRRNFYANRVQIKNFSALSDLPRPNHLKTEEIPSVRQRALEFSKKVPMPKCKVISEAAPIEKTNSEISDLLRMEMEHESIKASVVQIKSYLE